MLKGIIELGKKGVFAAALIKMRRCWPNMLGENKVGQIEFWRVFANSFINYTHLGQEMASEGDRRSPRMKKCLHELVCVPTRRMVRARRSSSSKASFLGACALADHTEFAHTASALQGHVDVLNVMLGTLQWMVW